MSLFSAKALRVALAEERELSLASRQNNAAGQLTE